MRDLPHHAKPRVETQMSRAHQDRMVSPGSRPTSTSKHPTSSSRAAGHRETTLTLRDKHLLDLKTEPVLPKQKFKESQPIHIIEDSIEPNSPAAQNHRLIEKMATHAFLSFLVGILLLVVTLLNAPTTEAAGEAVQQAADAGIKIAAGVYGPLLGFVFGAAVSIARFRG